MALKFLLVREGFRLLQPAPLAAALGLILLSGCQTHNSHGLPPVEDAATRKDGVKVIRLGQSRETPENWQINQVPVDTTELSGARTTTVRQATPTPSDKRVQVELRKPGSSQPPQARDAAVNTVWERMRPHFHLRELAGEKPQIDQQRLWYATRQKTVEGIAKRSAPYIFYIVEELDKRRMPMELALLPVIESSYNPNAYSPAHAAGLWQFIPSTGRNFKLKQTHWYDGRRDITASTQAALDYLQYLHKMFNGDWFLALAAYNSGEGTVSRAIKRNQGLGLPTDYWNLQLPRETREYVPRLLAVSQLFASPAAYGLNLPDVPNKPYFTQVPLKHQLELKHIAGEAKISEAHMKELNPAFKQGIAHDGPKHILVPAHTAHGLEKRLAKLQPAAFNPRIQSTAAARPKRQTATYRVRSGDSLSTIAQKHGTTVAQVRQLNNLKGNHLRAGQTLVMPNALQASASPTVARTSHYKVRKGDSLSVIAQRNGTTVAQIRQLNGLKGNAVRAGQTLKIPASGASAVASSAAAARTATRKPAQHKVVSGETLGGIAQKHSLSTANLRKWNQLTSDRLRPGQMLHLRAVPLQYVIRSGDTLSTIAQRHKVSIKQLQQWNPKQSKTLRPGQKLTIHL